MDPQVIGLLAPLSTIHKSRCPRWLGARRAYWHL